MNKAVLGVYPSPKGHWVGDGFPVRSLFSYDQLGRHTSPFLLLDYAGPMQFAPAAQPRGVGEHPHRGFETVTIVYQGEVAHRDSSGNSGVIRPGDVQWMTAASGILHDEFHSPEFTQRGGALEMVQLWVNLPAEHKMSKPRYQSILNAQIPQVALPEGAGSVRVIAGDYAGEEGTGRHVHRAQRLGRPLASPGAKSVCSFRRTTLRPSRCCTARSAPTALALRRTPNSCSSSAAAMRSRIAAQADSTLLILSGAPILRADRRLRALCDEYAAGDRNRDAGFSVGKIRPIAGTQPQRRSGSLPAS